MDYRLTRINTQLDGVYEEIDWLSENMWTEREIRNISSTVITDELVSAPNIKGAYIRVTIRVATFCLAIMGLSMMDMVATV